MQGKTIKITWTSIAVFAVLFSTATNSRAEQIEYSISDPVVTSASTQSVTWKAVLSGRVVLFSIKSCEMNASHLLLKSRKHSSTQSSKKADSAAVQAKWRIESISRLKQVMTGALMYESDEGKFPPMQNIDVLKKSLEPYVEDNAIFTQPGSGRPYMTNVFLSGKAGKVVASYLNMAAIYESQTGSDGKRAIAFLNGNVKRVTEAEWQKIKKVSKIK